MAGTCDNTGSKDSGEPGEGGVSPGGRLREAPLVRRHERLGQGRAEPDRKIGVGKTQPQSLHCEDDQNTYLAVWG